VSSPYTATGKNGISVADAKAYIATIDTGAISDQITHYTGVATSLNTVAQAVTTINNNLQATWSGSAADAANVQFGSMASQASNLASMLSDQVVPALTDAYTGAQKAQSAIQSVKDEITQVPGTATGREAGLNGNPSQNITPAVASQVGAPPDNPSNSMTADQAVAFNVQQRTAAANAMNTVATPYGTSATTFTTIANSARDTTNTPTSSSATGFNLTSSASGSNGAASGYQSTISTGGTSRTGAGSSGGTTKVQDFVPPSPPPPGTLPTSPPSSALPPPPVVLPISPPILASPPGSPPDGDPPVGDPPVGTTPVGSDPTSGIPGGVDPVTGLPVGSGTSGTGVDPAPGVFGEGGLSGSTGSRLVSGSTGFGEGSLAGGTGSGVVPGRTGFGDPAAGAVDTSVVGGPAVGIGTGQGADQSSVGMMGGGMPGGGAGGAGGGSQGSGPSASYLRGRYLGNDEVTDSVPSQWQNPAIGGSESVLIGGQPAEAGRVTSVYAGAQDGLGNPIGMMGGGGLGGGRGNGDENDDSGSRPGYLKEDPRWWTPEGSYVPPVVE
jgi:hypothetical protein